MFVVIHKCLCQILFERFPLRYLLVKCDYYPCRLLEPGSKVSTEFFHILEPGSKVSTEIFHINKLIVTSASSKLPLLLKREPFS